MRREGPGGAWGCPGWGEFRKELPQTLQRPRGPAGTLVSDFWSPELREDRFLVF